MAGNNTYTVTYNIKTVDQASATISSVVRAFNGLTDIPRRLQEVLGSFERFTTQMTALSNKVYPIKIGTASAKNKLRALNQELRTTQGLLKQLSNQGVNLMPRASRARAIGASNGQAIVPGATSVGMAPKTTPGAYAPSTSRQVSSGRAVPVTPPVSKSSYPIGTTTSALGYKLFGPTPLPSNGGMAIDMLKGMGIAYGIAGLGSMVSNIVRQSAEYDNLMATVRNILKTHDDGYDFNGRFAGMAQTVRKVGMETKYTVTEVADAAKFLAMAGFNLQGIQNAIRPIANLALVGDTELGETADLTTNIMTGYNIDPSQMKTAADVMTNTFTMTNTTLTEIAESYKYAGSLMSAGKVPFQEATAAIGILGDAGIKGSQAGTTLRTILANIINPTKKQKAAWKAVGVERFDKNGNMRSLVDIFEDLNKKNLDVSYFYRLFHKTAASGAVALAAHVDKWNDVFLENFLSGGLAEKLANEKKNTIQGLWAQLTSVFTDNGVTAFSGIQDVIKNMLQKGIEFLKTDGAKKGFKDVADSMMEFGRMMLDATKMFMWVFKALRPVIKEWIKFQIMIWPFVKAVTAFKTVMLGLMGLTRVGVVIRNFAASIGILGATMRANVLRTTAAEAGVIGAAGAGVAGGAGAANGRPFPFLPALPYNDMYHLAEGDGKRGFWQRQTFWRSSLGHLTPPRASDFYVPTQVVTDRYGVQRLKHKIPFNTVKYTPKTLSFDVFSAYWSPFPKWLKQNGRVLKDENGRARTRFKISPLTGLYGEKDIPVTQLPAAQYDANGNIVPLVNREAYKEAQKLHEQSQAAYLKRQKIMQGVRTGGTIAGMAGMMYGGSMLMDSDNGGWGKVGGGLFMGAGLMASMAGGPVGFAIAGALALLGAVSTVVESIMRASRGAEELRKFSESVIVKDGMVLTSSSNTMLQLLDQIHAKEKDVNKELELRQVHLNKILGIEASIAQAESTSTNTATSIWSSGIKYSFLNRKPIEEIENIINKYAPASGISRNYYGLYMKGVNGLPNVQFYNPSEEDRIGVAAVIAEAISGKTATETIEALETKRQKLLADFNIEGLREFSQQYTKQFYDKETFKNIDLTPGRSESEWKEILENPTKLAAEPLLKYAFYMSTRARFEIDNETNRVVEAYLNALRYTDKNGDKIVELQGALINLFGQMTTGLMMANYGNNQWWVDNGFTNNTFTSPEAAEAALGAAQQTEMLLKNWGIYDRQNIPELAELIKSVETMELYAKAYSALSRGEMPENPAALPDGFSAVYNGKRLYYNAKDGKFVAGEMVQLVGNEAAKQVSDFIASVTEEAAAKGLAQGLQNASLFDPLGDFTMSTPKKGRYVWDPVDNSLIQSLGVTPAFAAPESTPDLSTLPAVTLDKNQNIVPTTKPTSALDNTTGTGRGSGYKSNYHSSSAAPKQINIQIGSLMSVDKVDLSNPDKAMVIQNIKQELALALLDVASDCSDSLNRQM